MPIAQWFGRYRLCSEPQAGAGLLVPSESAACSVVQEAPMLDRPSASVPQIAGTIVDLVVQIVRSVVQLLLQILLLVVAILRTAVDFVVGILRAVF